MPHQNKSEVDQKLEEISYELQPPLSDVQAAEFLGVAVQTLRNWRSAGTGKGPAYLKLSPGPRGRVAYLIEDLQEYRKRCRVDPSEG